MSEALRAAADCLAATSDTARLDAELLMAHALGTSRSALLLRHMAEPAPGAFAELVERRARHEPVAYIVGHQQFYGLEFAVTPDVLIPRGDSETLIEAARAHFVGRAGPARIVDLGTGSGALLFAALTLWPEAHGIALDASQPALAVAQANAAALGLAGRTEIVRASWHTPGWAGGLGAFELILCNPPYVEQDAPLEPSVRDHEPAGALFAGPEGLDEYRVLVPQLGKLKNANGAIILEIGSNQAEAVARIAAGSGFAAALRRDLAGRPRALVLT